MMTTRFALGFILLLGACSGHAIEAKPRYLPSGLQQRLQSLRWTKERVHFFLENMPKVETHLHLDGALSPETIQNLARKQNYAPLGGKSLEEIRKLTVVDSPRESPAEVLEAFKTIYPLLRTPEAMEQVAYDLLASAKRQNIRYLEVRFAPSLQAQPGFSQEEVLRAVLRGLRKGEKSFGIKSGVIICLLRPLAWVSLEQNEEMFRLALQYFRRGVVGIDLAGNEAAESLAKYRDFYVRAKQAGMYTTVHAGETPNSGDLELALDLGVDRIGHAVLLSQKPELLSQVQQRRIPLEVNLTSNLRTGGVKDLSQHPVRDWFKAGIPVTLSTDDPGVFGIRLTDEYKILWEKLSFSPQEIAAVVLQGVDSLFLPAGERR